MTIQPTGILQIGRDVVEPSWLLLRPLPCQPLRRRRGPIRFLFSTPPRPSTSMSPSQLPRAHLASFLGGVDSSSGSPAVPHSALHLPQASPSYSWSDMVVRPAGPFLPDDVAILKGEEYGAPQGSPLTNTAPITHTSDKSEPEGYNE